MGKPQRQTRLPGWDQDDPPEPSALPQPSFDPPSPNPLGGPPDSRLGDPAEVPAAAPAEVSSSDAPPVEAPLDEPDLLAPQPLPDLRGQKVWVVDSMSLLFQVFHAIPAMTGPRGEPTNAVFGFTRDMFAILEQRKPDYLFCAFDPPGPTFRHTLYEAYKEHRSEMPADLVPQIVNVRRVLAALSIPLVEMPGFEADDVLATVARVCEEAGGECTIVTADKDCRQLISDRVRLFNMRKNTFFDRAALAEDWGIRPDQVVDFQTLVGDPVDNVPGVPLIGPKLARDLLQKFDTLEGIYQNLDQITGKRKENLLAHREQTLLSRRLVRLDSFTPVEIPWEQGRAGRYDPAVALDLFQEFGFHSLSDKMRGLVVARPVAWNVQYETIATPERLAWLIQEMSSQPLLSVDTETTSVMPRWAEIVGYSFAWQPGQAYYVPVRAPAGELQLDPAETLAALRPVLENPAVRKTGQNLKYDAIVLRSAGVELRGLDFDSMVASYLLDAGERNHNLDELALRYLNYQTTTIDTLIGSGKSQKRMDEVAVDKITHYAAEDADVALRLRPVLEEKLAASGLSDLLATVEVPLIDVLVELEFNGVRVDLPRLAELSRRYGERLLTLEAEIYELAGRPFNIGSPKQLQDILFVEQKLPILKRTKTGASTDVDVLEELARRHPLPAKIIEYRQFAKLKNTYVDALPHLVYPGTGRVHASFNQVVAATGRLSSSDPNLQNIPIRTDAGREIRSAFLPGHDSWFLLAADYSQIELRVLAHFSQDEALTSAFARDEDIHAQVACQVFSVPLDQVTSAQRRVAKAVNFGVIYGQSPFGLAKTIDIPQDQAAQFIDSYFRGYPDVERFLIQILRDCRQQQMVRTILCRRRAVTGVRDPGPPSTSGLSSTSSSADAYSRQRNLAERTAINTVIQGSAADIIKLAMLRVHRRLLAEKFRSRMLLQIHDELVFESPPEEVESLGELVRQEMSAAIDLRVPLKVDLKVGRNWAECE